MERPAKIAEDQFDISIAYDGTWMHQGAAMTRMPLVRLFSTVLQRDAAGDYWLITPVERGRIAVADAPFIAVSWRAEGQGPEAQNLYLTDNLGREAPVDAAHPLTLRMPRGGGAGPFIPYHQLGGGIEARLATSIYYDLVELALVQGKPDASGRLQIRSFGAFYPLGIV